FYYLGWSLNRAGEYESSAKAFARGEAMSPDFCFPNRLEAVLALRAAIDANPADAHAHHFLGNLYYDKRQYELAIEAWEKASRLAPAFPTVWRNLALAYFNKRGDTAKAVEMMERAFSLDETDSRILMELDQLYKRLRRPHAERLAFLQKYPELIKRRDDLVLEEITLLNQVGRYDEARQLLDSHIFHPWEGGEGKVPAQYQFARVEMAKVAIAEGRYADAVNLLEECLEYPHHLGEGKLHGAQENDFYYFLGQACDALGQGEKARECYRQATIGPTEPAAALYYNDAKPDKIFYAGLAYRALGEEDKARGLFNRLLDYGKQHLHDVVVMDYFAVSLPDLLIWEDDLQMRNEIHCKYMMALGYAGLGDMAHSRRYLDEVAALDINHQGILSILTLKM
ncbi:MAG: tetratricopeptide repeat protein, partial [Duncaniella sp.]|nr:tetratricopeptide repeat protein [Duncaniella sp.]